MDRRGPALAVVVPESWRVPTRAGEAGMVTKAQQEECKMIVGTVVSDISGTLH